MAVAMACAAAPACRVSLSLGSSSLRSKKGMASSCAAAVAPLRSSFRGIALSGCRTSSSISSGGAGTSAQRSMAPIVAAAGYKLKSHKASAKRFRVTGSGKIVRRQAGKAHLLRKKTTKRRNRLTGLTEVFRGDYDNVIGALPYLKVVR